MRVALGSTFRGLVAAVVLGMPFAAACGGGDPQKVPECVDLLKKSEGCVDQGGKTARLALAETMGMWVETKESTSFMKDMCTDLGHWREYYCDPKKVKSASCELCTSK